TSGVLPTNTTDQGAARPVVGRRCAGGSGTGLSVGSGVGCAVGAGSEGGAGVDCGAHPTSGRAIIVAAAASATRGNLIMLQQDPWILPSP
ncbi:MAG: hypothetical protein J0H64_09540, partial [Actinobacteria bacterium]|nr:hypothetical protein [Actinomycetota bacterium]